MSIDVEGNSDLSVASKTVSEKNMQAKPARASKNPRDQIHTLNIDLMDLSTPDNNGDRYVLDACVQATSYGDVELMKRKAASVTVRHFAKLKNRIEAITAPGKPDIYLFGRVHRDKGTEFEGNSTWMTIISSIFALK